MQSSVKGFQGQSFDCCTWSCFVELTGIAKIRTRVITFFFSCIFNLHSYTTEVSSKNKPAVIYSSKLWIMRKMKPWCCGWMRGFQSTDISICYSLFCSHRDMNFPSVMEVWVGRCFFGCSSSAVQCSLCGIWDQGICTLFKDINFKTFVAATKYKFV